MSQKERAGYGNRKNDDRNEWSNGQLWSIILPIGTRIRSVRWRSKKVSCSLRRVHAEWAIALTGNYIHYNDLFTDIS